MTCPYCGAALPEQARFCGVCGKAVTTAPSAGPLPPQYDRSMPTNPPARPGLVSGSISTGWRVFTGNAGLFIGMCIVFMLIAVFLAGAANLVSRVLGLQGIEAIVNSGDFSLGTILGAISWELLSGIATGAISAVLLVGFQMAALKVMRGLTPAFSDLFSVFPFFLTIFIAYLLNTLAVLAGLLLLVIPGIILSLGLYQYSLLVADKHLSAVDALKTSWDVMRGAKGSLFLLFLVVTGINLLGLLALVIGLVVTVPLTVVIFAAFYKQTLDDYERTRGPIGGRAL